MRKLARMAGLFRDHKAGGLLLTGVLAKPLGMLLRP